jgi:hypothetical protein
MLACRGQQRVDRAALEQLDVHEEPDQQVERVREG